ncbi:unnamed protein product [marine sediment metagenome]|uniref:Uncharacterized protein n=1 Tax=marine sediment metagenome TaxID=412755 RepID=X1S972_9ZZZZ
MIKALIENYETLSVVGIFAIAIVWYLYHQTKAQTEREKKHDEQQLKREEKHDKQQDEDRKFPARPNNFSLVIGKVFPSASLS